MKRMSLSLAVIAILGLSGCNSDSSETQTSSTQTDSREVTVERGPVYSATVKDANGQIASQNTGENIYTFKNTIQYPVTVKGGWVDLNNNKIADENDINLNIEMKSYSNIITPISTYIADSNKTKRENKLEELLNILNDNSDDDITSEDLLKVASKAPRKAQMAINAVYAEMIENDGSTNINIDDINGRINELKNINTNQNTSLKDSATTYEKYIINDSDISSNINNDKISNNNIIKYNMPVLDKNTINRNSQAVTIINDYPIEYYTQLQSTYKEEYNNLKFYKTDNNSTTCNKDFEGYGYCNEESVSKYGYVNYNDTMSIVAIYDIPNYTIDTSNAGINDLVGKTFYTIDKESINDGYVYYSKIVINSLVPEIDDKGSIDYSLSNGEWIEENYTDEDIETTSIEGDRLKIISTYNDEYDGSKTTSTIYLSIVEKTPSYWTIKSDGSDDDGVSYVDYKKWYLSPTEEMLNPSLLNVQQ